MAEASFFDEIVQSVTNHGRRLLFSSSQTAHLSRLDIEELAQMLLSTRGEASGMTIAAAILKQWRRLDEEGVRDFFAMLAARFGPDDARLEAAIRHHAASPNAASVAELHQAAEPRRQELLRRLNLAPGGTAGLVELRDRLLCLPDPSDELRAVDADFAHLFASWFNRGFLTLRPIDWSTPADILEKIIRYEAVHAIDSWEELRRRLVPADRRCFAFFHPRLADEPLVFVEVALTRSIPDAIHDVLDPERRILEAEDATTAVFYSISNCQNGLRGISFGNFLIKQVVEDLSRDLPNLKTFVTLSPVPGFAHWLARLRREAGSELSPVTRESLRALDDAGWPGDRAKASRLREAIVPLVAQYFLVKRASDGRPIDPVARFHLGNGARLERINFLGDPSPKAMEQAHGLMVNYLYKLGDIIANHEALAQHGRIVAARDIERLWHENGSRKPALKALSTPRQS